MKRNRHPKVERHIANIGLKFIPHGIVTFDKFLQSHIAKETIKALSNQNCRTEQKVIAFLAVYQVCDLNAHFIQAGLERQLAHSDVEEYLRALATRFVVENYVEVAKAIGNEGINQLWRLL